jgi:mono/diheme cytochrome c family protein
VRSSDHRFITLACLLGLAQSAACGDERQPDTQAPPLENQESEVDAGAEPDPAVDAPARLDGGGARAPDASARTDAASADVAAWRLPTPGACGDTPLSFATAEGTGASPDWSEGAKVPITGLPNRYGLPASELDAYVRKGRGYATFQYPIDVTGSWLPHRLMETVFAEDEGGPIEQLKASANPLSKYKDLDDFEQWLGLSAFPDCDGKGAQAVPFPAGQRPDYRMGSTRTTTADGDKITYSCAGCHASRLFGRSILGLQNRFSRANVGIDQARTTLQGLPVDLVRLLYPMTDGEARILTRLQEALSYVQTKKPVLRGLDTSLAQVALSLAKRAKDPYATREPALAKAPRPDRLTDSPADSKPGNWWVLKYKNRWLLDGSVVSGNPVYTNIIWNEIGRGTDLHELEGWLDANQKTVDELTAAVFAAEPVRFTEFFPAESIDIDAAKRGKQLFDGTCASCHGSYQKGWELPHAASLPLADRLATVEVRYHETTPVYDVGTDTLRLKGMASLVQLNDLAISKKSGVVIKEQTGYVPPPLVGIWARFPYFHNNSAPSLCAVLTKASERPATYYAGQPDDPKRDFDEACNGYPTGDQIPAAWKKDPEGLFDANVPGLGNQGHDEGVFLKDGVELFTPAQKRDIIEFLQTL